MYKHLKELKAPFCDIDIYWYLDNFFFAYDRCCAQIRVALHANFFQVMVWKVIMEHFVQVL